MAVQASSKSAAAQRRVFGFAVLLACALFLAHTTLLFDFATFIMRHHQWLIEHLGPSGAGKAMIMGCFVMLFAIHVGEAATWGLYLWRQGLCSTLTEGAYFAGVTITALGYGDLVLPPPWRLLSPLIAITGLLKFGCSTAFLFVIIQAVWVHHL